ncbi:hypothetical protein LDENG_00228120 [Lucifuga dentata]|nr:hypothetical protein LDENG_00228120 [Lucifuga dentata]
MESILGLLSSVLVYEAVRWIQLAAAVLSILGSSSIIVYVVLQRLACRPELQPLFLLSVSDFLLALCWLIGAAIYTTHCGHTHTDCYHLHTAEELLYMASFFYMLNYMWSLYMSAWRKFCCITGLPVQFSDRMISAGKTTALLSGLLPVLLMMPVFIQGNISQCQANDSAPYRCLLMHTGALYLNTHHQQPIRACRLLHTYRIAVFLTTFILTLTGIMVLMGKARRIHRRVVTSHGYLGDQQRASFRLVDRRMILYPTVFVFCWGPAACLAALRFVEPSACQGVAGSVLYISQAFTSASQGFFNCLVYGWKHTRFRHVRTVLSQDVDTQTPLLQCQKKKRGYQTLLRPCRP